jgi:signal transduction histidine kinase
MQGSLTELFAGGGELGALMRETDWAATPLGPVEKWPQALKTAVRIVLTSRQPMFVWWGNELINLYNDAYCSILGGKHPWALGKPAAEVWRDIWNEVGPRARSAMKENEGTYDEALELIMERNGYPEETYYTFSYSPVPNDEGGTGGIFCANSDDTQRIIGERQLALLRELAARTAEARTVNDACSLSARCFDGAPRDLPFALIYLVDSEHRTATLRGSSGILLPHAAAPESVVLTEPGPWPFREVVSKGQPILIDNLQSRFSDLPHGAWEQPPHRAMAYPIAAAGQNGIAGILIAGLNPYRLFDDSYRGFAGLISNQLSAAIGNAQAYEEERKRAEALAEIDRAKTTFFSNVSHEFRTPLMLMLAPVEEALADTSEPLSNTQRDRLMMVDRNGRRMLKLVNSLLDFARIEAGRVQADYVRTDLGTFTAELASSFRSAMERAGLKFTIDCPPGIDDIWVDREMWEKIVLNLLSNAFKFTFEGEIRVSVEEHAGKARLSVSDTGVGIAPDQIERVFERFHRIEGARGRTFEGTGIGLALVQELTRLHGGTVSVVSQEGAGSTFCVEIPTGHSHLPADKIRARRDPAARSNAEAYAGEALRWLSGKDGGESYGEPSLPGDSPFLQKGVGAKQRVLLADDNADMREYVARLLSDVYSVEAVSNGRAALHAILRERPDIVLSDVMMPELDGFGLIRAIREDSEISTLPVILLSARAGEEATVEGLSHGADDYLVKPFAARELRARVAGNLRLARLRVDAMARERQLRLEAEQAQARIAEVLESITDAFISLDRDWRYTYVNHVAATMGRRKAAELLGKVMWDEFPELLGSQLETELHRIVREQKATQFEFYYSEFELWTEWHAYPTPEGVSAFFSDITLKKRLDDQIKQTAKLESLGVLAGGVAHDFNNLLVGILGNASLVQEMLPEADPVKPMLDDVVKAGERAAELTQQLLAYSGKGRFIVEPVNLADLVRENQSLLRLSMSGNVGLHLDLPDRLPAIQADRAQMQQIVMNLMINGAEAVGTLPGEVHVTVRETDLRAEPAASRYRGFDLPQGRYVELTIEDNGCGMTPETLRKIFDPFFTTKFTGRGLGLAAVQGIVRAHRGAISVNSSPGKGTAFHVMLPAAAEEPAPSPPLAETAGLKGSGTILIIDDEAAVLSAASLALQAHGYATLTAGNGLEGMTLFERNPEKIDAVILDMTMPVMTGEQTLPELRRIRPDITVILSSGFTEDEVARRFSGMFHDGFIHKPYTAAALARTVYEIVSVRKSSYSQPPPSAL